MQYTKNFNLKKPDVNDFYRISDFNENMDALEEALSFLYSAAEWKKIPVEEFAEMAALSNDSWHMDVYENEVRREIKIIFGRTNIMMDCSTCDSVGIIQEKYRPAYKQNGFACTASSNVCIPCVLEVDSNLCITFADYDRHAIDTLVGGFITYTYKGDES